MTVFLERSAWTPSGVGGATLGGASLLGTAIHYPGTAQDSIGDPGQAAIASRLRGYRDYHVNTRGWSDIGYNFAIDQGGRVWRCRSDNWGGSRIGAHCASPDNPDANTEWMGVLLVIGDAETPNPKMVQAFRDWRTSRFLARWPGRTAIRGHRQVPGAQTDCPGDRTIALINGGVFAGNATPPPPATDWLDMATKEDVKDAVREVLAERAIALDWDGGPPNAREVSVYEALSYVHFNAADGSFVGTVPATSSRVSHRGRPTFGADVKAEFEKVKAAIDAIIQPGDGEPATP